MSEDKPAGAGREPPEGGAEPPPEPPPAEQPPADVDREPHNTGDRSSRVKPSHRLLQAAEWVALLALVLAPGLLVWHALSRPSGKQAVVKSCNEPKARKAAPGKSGVQLQTNRARPTMAIALADKESALDTITFSSKKRQVVPDIASANTSAVMIEPLRSGLIEPFDGKVNPE